MPISDQFVTKDAPEWVWGDPSQLAAAKASAEQPETAEDQQAAASEPEQVGQPWVDVLVGAGMFLFCQLIVAIIALIVYVLVAIPEIDLNRLQFIQQDHPGISPAIAIPVAISTMLMAWGWAHVGNRTPKTLMNWGFKKTDFLWGLLAVGVSVVVGNVVGLLLKVPAEETSQLNNAIWPEGITPVVAGFMALAVAVLVPIAEEMIFRGIIQNALARRYNDVVGLIGGAIIFAIPHIPNFIQLNVSGVSMAAGMIQVTILGFVIGGIFVYTRRLGACIAAHIFNNTLAVSTLIYMTFFAG